MSVLRTLTPEYLTLPHETCNWRQLNNAYPGILKLHWRQLNDVNLGVLNLHWRQLNNTNPGELNLHDFGVTCLKKVYGIRIALALAK